MPLGDSAYLRKVHDPFIKSLSQVKRTMDNKKPKAPKPEEMFDFRYKEGNPIKMAKSKKKKNPNKLNLRFYDLRQKTYEVR